MIFESHAKQLTIFILIICTIVRNIVLIFEYMCIINNYIVLLEFLFIFDQKKFEMTGMYGIGTVLIYLRSVIYELAIHGKNTST